MSMARTERWERAKADWPGFPVRDILVGTGALVLALIVLALIGLNALEAVIVGSAGLVVLGLYPVGLFAWAWFRAPLRLIEDEVASLSENVQALRKLTGAKVGEHDAGMVALRERTASQMRAYDARLTALETAPNVTPAPRDQEPDRRLTLLNLVRLGKIAFKTPGTRAGREWAESVVRTMNQLGLSDDLALFLAEDELGRQVSLMERIAAKYQTAGDDDQP
jgi:hypothetical protein